MALDPNKTLQQSKIPPGTVLLEAGENPSLLCIVHSGEVVHSYGKALSNHLYRLGSNSSPGFSSIIKNKPYPCKVTTAKETIISVFPVKTDSFKSMILGKLNMGMIAVRSLAQEFLILHQTTQKFIGLNQLLLKNLDNLTLAYLKSNPDAIKMLPQNGTQTLDPLMANGKNILDNFNTKSGGSFPSPITQQWLDEDHAALFGQRYGFNFSYNTDEFVFLRRILSLPPEIQGAMYKKDLNILHGLADRLATYIESALQDMLKINQELDKNLSLYFRGEYCIVEKFKMLSDLAASNHLKIPDSELLSILQFVTQFSDKILSNYKAMSGQMFSNVQPSLELLKNYVSDKNKTSQPVAKQSSSPATGKMDADGIKRELKGSPLKIMNFLGIPLEDSRKILGEIKTFKGYQNPMDSGGDPRKTRRAISKLYIDFYEKAYYKYKESPNTLPMSVKLMLKYGFFDDELLDDEHLITLYQLKDETSAKDIFPIYHAPDWVDLVGKKEEPPSVDEMGMTYFEKLKNDNKDKGWKKESDLPEEYNSYEKRVHYEIHNFLDTTIRLTSGSPATAFPILTKHQITIPLEKCMITNQLLSDSIEKLLLLDYSVFHREVIVNDEAAGILKEFVQERVIPNFIIVPSIGTKIMMWQDLSGRSKSSRGRFAVPAFASVDFFTMLLEAVGAFRWELTKTIQGADWNNVSIPSITADYTDYIQFYKKIRELNQEQKEKLATEFKRFRTDRDRFVNDYLNWLKFESEGVLKLNKVARGIFYRHVPFAKDIRDKLSAQPAYMDIHNRFTNIRNRKFRELEVKYRKYGESLPPLLQNNLDFYKV